MDKKTINQFGFTLIELMIALALGLLLSASVIMIFVSNKETSNLQEQLARIQENSRFATDILVRAIRPAGYSGCGTSNAVNTLNDGYGKGSQFNLTEPLTGFNDVSAATYVTLIGTDGPPETVTDSHQIKYGTDILMTKRVSPTECTVGTMHSCPPSNPSCGVCTCSQCAGGTVAASGQFEGGCELYPGDTLMVTNCVDSVVFQLTTCQGAGGANNTNKNVQCSESAGKITFTMNTGTGSPGNCSSQWGADHEGSSVMKAKAEYYMIRVKDMNGDGDFVDDEDVPALYRWTLNVGFEELVEYIDDLQIVYGTDTTSPGDRILDTYEEASASKDWSDVYSVRFEVTGRSPSLTATPDGILTKAISTTVAVRNQLP